MSWRHRASNQGARRSFQRIELASRQIAPLCHGNVQRETYRKLRPLNITRLRNESRFGKAGPSLPQIPVHLPRLLHRSHLKPEERTQSHRAKSADNLPTIEQKAINAGAACGDRLPAPANLPNRYRLNWRQSGGFLLPVIRKPLYLLG